MLFIILGVAALGYVVHRLPPPRQRRLHPILRLLPTLAVVVALIPVFLFALYLVLMVNARAPGTRDFGAEASQTRETVPEQADDIVE